MIRARLVHYVDFIHLQESVEGKNLSLILVDHPNLIKYDSERGYGNDRSHNHDNQEDGRVGSLSVKFLEVLSGEGGVGEKGPKAVDHEEEGHLLWALGCVLDCEVRYLQGLLIQEVEREHDLRPISIVQSLDIVEVLNQRNPEWLFIGSDHVLHIEPEEINILIFEATLHLSLSHVGLNE